MNKLLRTALLLEEKAARLPRESDRRAELLALVTAARRLGIEPQAYDYEAEHRIGSHQKRACVWSEMTAKMPDGPDKTELERKAERAAIHSALDRLGVG